MQFVELLQYFMYNHKQKFSNYLIKQRLIQKLFALFGARNKTIPATVIKFFKAVLVLNEDMLNKYIKQN